jgi:hypothetical protein
MKAMENRGLDIVGLRMREQTDALNRQAAREIWSAAA